MKENELKVVYGRRYIRSYCITMFLKIQKYKQRDICFIAILKGGLFTLFEILRSFPYPETGTVFGYLGLQSYKNSTKSNRDVKVTYPLDLDRELVEGKNVWIVDDISDTGLTLDRAKALITENQPASIHTAVLVDKPKLREELNFPRPDVVGVTYEGSGFLVGFGMGYGEQYRGLREICELVVKET